MGKIKNWSRRKRSETSSTGLDNIYVWNHDHKRGRKVIVTKEKARGRSNIYNVTFNTPKTGMGSRGTKEEFRKKFNDRSKARKYAVNWMRNNPHAGEDRELSENEVDGLEMVHNRTRSDRAKKIDESTTSDNTFDKPVTESEERKWRKDKGEYDIEGIDTKGD